jgi:hypothetical protein
MAFTWQTLAAVENSTLQNEQYRLRPAQKAAFTIYGFFFFTLAAMVFLVCGCDSTGTELA